MSYNAQEYRQHGPVAVDSWDKKRPNEVSGSQRLPDQPMQTAIGAQFVAANIERLYREVNELDSVIEMLYMKLAPVLRPQPPQEESKVAQEAHMSPLGDTLSHFGVTLSVLSNKVLRISEALDL